MVTSFATLILIQRAIDRHYRSLRLFLFGDPLLDEDSEISTAYYHTFLTPPDAEEAPESLAEARKRLRRLYAKIPTGEAATFAVAATDAEIRLALERQNVDTKAKISQLILANDTAYKRNALQNPTRTAIQDTLIKESTLGTLKEELRNLEPTATATWRRVVLTELSNTIGNASVDRIIDDHLQESGDVNTEEVYTYRVIVADSATCIFCRRFYGDVGEVPKVYRLSTLLANGTNFGLRQASWKPVVGSTHPNTRTSQIIELPPGYIPLPGGAMEFVGAKPAQEWIKTHLQN